MNKSEVIKGLSLRELKLSSDEIERVLDGFLELVTIALACGEEVKLHGFGKFEPRKHPPATRRNPRTGEPVQVPERTAIGFKPSNHLKARVNGAEATGADNLEG